MKLRCLGDFVELRQGLAINKGSAHLVSNIQDITYCYPLLRIADMMDSNFSKFVSKDVNSSVIANPQDIIYTRTGQIGLAFRGMQGVVHNNSFIVSLKTDELEKDYLYTVLNSNFVKKQANSQAKNSVQPDLTHTMFKSIVIPVPDSREEQNRISKIINNINQKIQTNNQINQELEAMAKTLYDYWFVQFDFPDQNGKPYKSSGGKMVYHPELKREIPEGWEVSKVGELQITTGKRDANFGTENGKYDFWTTANSPIKADEFSFEGKAILIAGNGNFYVNFTEGKFEAYQRTYVIQSEDENILIFMYMACLQSAEKLRKGSNGSIIKYITIGDVNNIASPYNKKIVDDFVKIYSPLIDLISKNKRQNQELTQLRDWLLPMLMNGQVKVE